MQSAIVAWLSSYDRPLAAPMLINSNDEAMYQNTSKKLRSFAVFSYRLFVIVF